MNLQASKGIVALLVFAGAVLTGCAALPSLAERQSSFALADNAHTLIGRAITPSTAAHPGLTGVHVLLDGRDAFAARAMMADNAERSLDVQYYIWRNDTIGTLLFSALRRAAERGVRVRLLLDDNNTVGLDHALAVLDAHPRIEVRLFNPFPMRGARMLGFLVDFARLNRRMHNKSYTMDGMVTIVGGRNIGDEYFDATGELLFSDVDVLALGPVVDLVQQDFDRYWNSRSAYPAAPLVGLPGPGAMAAFELHAARIAAAPQAQAYLQAMRDSRFVADLDQRALPLEWAPVWMLSDDPAKTLNDSAPESSVAHKLPALLGTPIRQADLVSPYFVPGPKWTPRLAGLAASGIKVRILTNSLEATDVAAVHAGYAKWRAELLRGGVTLYELKRAWRRDAKPKRDHGVIGSSSSSLHAKAMAVDRERVFVGSFNFDPRSVELNTEMGLVIESGPLASMVDTLLNERMPLRAYEVRLTPDGKLYWIDRRVDGSVVRHDREPGTSAWRRAVTGFMSLLPIDWLL